MQGELSKEARDRLLGSIKKFAAEELDQDWGDLKAGLMLDFFLREIGPSIYNAAVADAQKHLLARVEEMDAVVHQAEFGYWKR